MPSSKQIVVIGGGISGLACAWRLRKLDLPVLLLEGSPRFGGVIGTVEKNGFRFDLGPQSFMAGGPLLALIEQLGLAGQLCHAPRRAPRYILKQGRLVPAPLGPIGLFGTPLLGWKTKLRLVGEPFGRTHPPADDESVAAFVRRKFGDDLLENLAVPFISGVYAGDTEKLSMRSTFPRLREFEEQSGSLARGAIESRRARKKSRAAAAAGKTEPAPRPELSNFRDGILTLTEALAARLGDAARHSIEVLEIRPPAAGSASPESAAGTAAGFQIVFREAGVSHSLEAAAVILATPTAQAARLLTGIDRRFADALLQIAYAPVAQVSAGYRLKEISPLGALRRGDEFAGFGFLVPRSEGLRLLGTVWNSALFPGRAPEGAASFTSFLGGATDPGICQLGEEEIARIACAELGGVLRAGGPPVVENVATWQRAIPQYNLGHPRIVASLQELCDQRAGIFLAGSYLSGPAIPACVEQAGRVAEDAARFLGSAP